MALCPVCGKGDMTGYASGWFHGDGKFCPQPDPEVKPDAPSPL